MNTATIASIVKKYPRRCLILAFIAFMQLRAYVEYKFIWPLSHKTVMYSAPVKYPFEKLFLYNENDVKVIGTKSFVPKFSKLSFLYRHYHLKDKSYLTFLEKLARGHKELRNGRVLLMLETIHEFKPLCQTEDQDIRRAACLEEGIPCK